MLPEDTLLEIFDIYRLDTMVWSRDGHRWDWLRLAHVCRRWRHVISISPHRLDLWILCKSGVRPIERILRSTSWSSVPLIVRFKAAEAAAAAPLRLPDNIAAALRHWDRICEIDLVLTREMVGPIVEVIHEPLQALKSIRVTVKNSIGPLLIRRNSLLGGSAPQLREIKLDGIAFPFSAVRRLVSSTNNLVELQLSNIPNDAYFSPDELITTLSNLVHLKSLTIGFHSPASRPPPASANSTTHRPFTTKRTTTTTTLSYLTQFDFHGASEYLEDFVSPQKNTQTLNLPSLTKLSIKLFNQIQFEIPQFSRFFIPRIEALRSPTWIFVTHSAESVSVMFVQEGKPSNENFSLSTAGPCKRLNLQLSFVTQITSQLSPFVLSSVHSLSIKKAHNSEMPSGAGGRDSEEEDDDDEDDVDSAQWLELFQPFRHLTQVHVWEKQLVPGIVQALVSEEGGGVVSLPELSSLHLSGYRKSPSVAKAAEEFVATRRLAGRTVRLIG